MQFSYWKVNLLLGYSESILSQGNGFGLWRNTKPLMALNYAKANYIYQQKPLMRIIIW